MDGRLYALTKTKTDLDGLQDPAGGSRSIDKDQTYIDGAVIAPGTLPADALPSHSLTTDYLDTAEVQAALVTKEQVETVLTGEVTSHTHAVIHELPIGGSVGQILGKANETDYQIEWLDAPVSERTIFGTATIPTAGWIANEGEYAYRLDLPIAGLLVTHVVSASINVADISVALAAQLCPTIASYDGGLTFYAKEIPAATIGFSYAYTDTPIENPSGQILMAGTNIFLVQNTEANTLTVSAADTAYQNAVSGGYTGDQTAFNADLAAIEGLEAALAAIIGG